MISVVRFLGRQIFARGASRSRWVRRTVIVMAVFRWINQRSDRPYDIRLQRGEEVDILITKERNGR